MNKFNGFVLLPVLIFLQISALFGLYELNAQFFNIKITHQLWNRQVFDYLVQQQLYALEKNANFACKMPVISPAKLTRKNLTWWQQQACTFRANNIQFYFAIEFLGINPCGIVELDNHTLIAEYYRISLLGISSSLKKVKSIWQSTIVMARHDIGQCNSQKHIVLVGKQMQRELIPSSG